MGRLTFNRVRPVGAIPAQDRPPWLRRHRAVAILLALMLVAAAATVVVAWLGPAVDTYVAVRGDLVQSVVASGQVVSPQRSSIAAETTARVVRVAVDEGATVTRGQALVELDSSDEEAALLQARAAVAQSEAKQRQIVEVGLPAARENLRQALANMTQSRASFDRTRDLVDRKFLAPAQLDDARRNLDVAQSQVRAAELQVQSNSPGGADDRLAAAAAAEARAALRVAQTKRDATVVRAPADGLLIARAVEAGDVAQAGKELMVLAPAGETEIVVNIDEKNLAKLSPGQRALVSADAYPGQSFPAELIYVNPGVDAARGAVQVKLRVPHPPAYLRQDMSVSVDVEVSRRDNVVVVPAGAVHDGSTAQPWVLAVRGNRAVRQTVVLGMRGDAAIEVVEGVSPGEAMIPVTNGGVHVRARVRSQPLPMPPAPGTAPR